MPSTQFQASPSPTPTVLFTTTIHAPLQQVFDTITDLECWNSWLEHSFAFKGTTEISHHPVELGSTYAERSLTGTRYGRVVRLESPQVWRREGEEMGGLGGEKEGLMASVVFEQPMRAAPAWLGVEIGIQVALNLWEEEMVVEKGDFKISDEPKSFATRGDGKKEKVKVTVVERRVEVSYPLLVRLFGACFLDSAFVKEGRRCMDALKVFCESGGNVDV